MSRRRGLEGLCVTLSGVFVSLTFILVKFNGGGGVSSSGSGVFSLERARFSRTRSRS